VIVAGAIALGMAHSVSTWVVMVFVTLAPMVSLTLGMATHVFRTMIITTPLTAHGIVSEMGWVRVLGIASTTPAIVQVV